MNQSFLCGGGNVESRLGRAGRRIAFVQDRLRNVGATAAARGDAERIAELMQAIDTGRFGAAYLFVGDGFADADVHRINKVGQQVSGFAIIGPQMRMIVNHVTGNRAVRHDCPV